MGDAPIHQVTRRHLVHVRGRRFGLQNCASVRAVSETRRVTISHRIVRIGPLLNRSNEGIIRVDDIDFLCVYHNRQVRDATVCHFVKLCGPHNDSQCHKSTFGTLCGRHVGPLGHKSTCCSFVWATRRFARAQVNIVYICVGDTPVHKVTS